MGERKKTNKKKKGEGEKENRSQTISRSCQERGGTKKRKKRRRTRRTKRKKGKTLGTET